MKLVKSSFDQLVSPNFYLNYFNFNKINNHEEKLYRIYFLVLFYGQFQCLLVFLCTSCLNFVILKPYPAAKCVLLISSRLF